MVLRSTWLAQKYFNDPFNKTLYLYIKRQLVSDPVYFTRGNNIRFSDGVRRHYVISGQFSGIYVWLGVMLATYRSTTRYATLWQ